MNNPERITVIYGGVSGEHEVSIDSARSVMAALEQAGYGVQPIIIGRDGRWRLATSEEEVFLGRRGVLYCRKADGCYAPYDQVQMAFPVLHGTLGEDGTIQGLLEILEIPYVGARVLGSALGLDKITQKRLLLQAGIPVTQFVVTTRAEIEANVEDVATVVEEGIPYPCFVKPSNLGSSVGISKARDRNTLVAGLKEAARYDRRVLVEKGVDARELEVSVIGNDNPIASIPGEVIPGREFYDYIAKYGDAGSETLIPAPISEAVAERVRELAKTAFRVLDLSGMARIDFLMDKNNQDIFLNEANTIPGFTNISMFAKLWAGSGLDFPGLVRRLVELGLERHQDMQKSLDAARLIPVQVG